ncbi:MAG: hypothetical protein J0M34_04935 [Alphaproteobacteria bacterium]|nr:hypothetical protein [Alphaproteobacteria bacterium]
MKWSQKMAEDGSAIVSIVCDTGWHEMYFVMRVARGQEHKIHHALEEGGKIMLEQYGEILDSGFGPLPASLAA